MNMEVTTGQIIVFYIVMVLLALSGIIATIATSANKGGDWENKK